MISVYKSSMNQVKSYVKRPTLLCPGNKVSSSKKCVDLKRDSVIQ